VPMLAAITTRCERESTVAAAADDGWPITTESHASPNVSIRLRRDGRSLDRHRHIHLPDRVLIRLD
jgi:hypothetical protein